MRKSQLIYLLLLLTGFYACQQSDESIIPQESIHSILIQPIFPDVEISVKSGNINVGKDLIYAYPFGVGVEFDGAAIAPDSISSTSYSYYLPQAKEDIIFTNAIEEEDSYQILSNNDSSSYLEFILQDTIGASNTDLVVGTLAEEDMADSMLYQIPLKRVVSKFTIQLKMLTKEGTPITDLSQYIKDANLQISPLGQKYIIKDDLEGSYSGTSSVIWSVDSIISDSVIQVCSNSYTFPSVSGSNPELSLSLKSVSGQTQQLNKAMSYAIEANKHYKLTLVVRLKSTVFDFVFEDFIEEEISIGDFEDVTTN